MSFRLFIWYCALCGGWAAFIGWALGRMASPNALTSPVGSAGIKGMWLGIMIALGLSLVDTLWSLSLRQFGQIVQRVGVAILVGCVGGLLGGIIGQALYGYSRIFFVFGWTLTGLLVGTSIGVYEVLSSVVRQQDVAGARKKLIKGLVGGTVGGVLGGILAMLLGGALPVLLKAKDPDLLWSPTSWGFVALGMCIGLLIGLAQVMLKEAWLRIEQGRRVGREMIVGKDQITIGRAESCDLGLFGDNQIEKLHARIVQQGNRYFVEDTGSSGGTYVNEQRIFGPTPLQSGDKIRVGGHVLSFGERQKRSNG